MKHIPLKTQTHHLNHKSTLRTPSILRALLPLSQSPGMLSLGAGYPNPNLFPLSTLSMQLKTGQRIEINAEETRDMLQYTTSYGLPRLIDMVKGMMEREHGTGAVREVLMTTGSQDGLCKAFEGLCEKGDVVLVETPTYSGALAILKPMEVGAVGVECDWEGIVPERLEGLLKGWEERFPGKRKPRVLYTVPTGQNPSGTTLPMRRREEIYRIACEHDLIIIEDDPYWFLTFDKEQGLKSFLGIDVERRVIRLDSLSKVLSSGLRTGWMTGPKELIEVFQYSQQVSDLHTSGVSQMIVYKILSEWGDEKFLEHVSNVQKFYLAQRDIFLRAAETHLTGLATWNVPKAGMFIWLDLNGIDDAEDLILKRGVEQKVLFVPGSYFMADGRKTGEVRASYSFVDEEKCNEALRRLSVLIKSN